MTNNNQLQKDEDEIYRELYPEINWCSPELAIYQHIPPYKLTQARERAWDKIQNKKSPE